VSLKLSPNIKFCLFRMVTKIRRGQKSHIASRADPEGWGHDPKTTRARNVCACLLRIHPLTGMLGESFPEILSGGFRILHQFAGSEKFQMALGTTR
jgi:hypothetical protein